MHDLDHPQPAHIEVGLHNGPVPTATLRWPNDCGAESIFLGRTREQTHAEFGPLQRLEYDVYVPMARKLLVAMAEDATVRFGCRAVRIVHARGPVAIGEASIVIQVAAPHRDKSFAACRHLIERIKHELPVWKREIWQDGETFVEGCCPTGSGRPTTEGTKE